MPRATTKNARDFGRRFWFSSNQSPLEDSFCAGYRAAEAAAAHNNLCKDAIRIDKPTHWREGVLYYYKNTVPVGLSLRITSDSECWDGVLTPPPGLIQQCATSLFGCDIRNPYSGWMLWPRVDIGGVYIVSPGPAQRFDPGLSGGFIFGYWLSPRRIPFRLLTLNLSFAMGSTQVTNTVTNSNATVAVLRYGGLISLLQSVLVLEAGGYYLAASDSVLGGASRNSPFVRFAINLADLPNLRISDVAADAARLLEQKSKANAYQVQESGDIR